MKLRNAIKLAAVAALVLPAASVMSMEKMAGEIGMLAGGTVNADPTNAWTVDSSGAITAGCPVGYTCAANSVNEAGMVQQMIEDSAGTKYIRTIVAETDGTGDDNFTSQSGVFFGDESWVVMGSAKGGLSGRSMIADENAAGDVFEATGQLNTGTFMPMLMASEVANDYAGDMQAALRDHGAMVEFGSTMVNTATGLDDSFDFKHGMYMGMDMATSTSFTAKYAALDLKSTITGATNGAALGSDRDAFSTAFNFSETDWEDSGNGEYDALGAMKQEMAGVNYGKSFTIESEVADGGAADGGVDDFAQNFLTFWNEGAMYNGGTLLGSDGSVVGGASTDLIKGVIIDQYVGQAGNFSLADASDNDGGDVIEIDSFISDTFVGTSVAGIDVGTALETGSIIGGSAIGAELAASLFNDYDSAWAYAYDAGNAIIVP